MKKRILATVAGVILFQLSFAQMEVVSNNNVKIGATATSNARLTIEPQYGDPDNSNLLIGDWYNQGVSAISLGVSTSYSWLQTWKVTPLQINKLGNDVLICTGNWGSVGLGYNISNPSAKLHVNGSIYATGTITYPSGDVHLAIFKRAGYF